MAKFQSPLLGYNNNVRYQGRVFHIQTEDSGINHPHIITHLFMDGGRILKSVKTSYAQHLGIEGMSETVRVMMKDQHKAMVVALKEGQFDSLLDGGGAKRPAGPADAPPAEHKPAAPTVSAQPVPPNAPQNAPPTAPPAVPAAPLHATPVQVVAPAVMAARFASVSRHDSAPVSVQVSTERRPKRDEVTHAAPAHTSSLPIDELPPELEAMLRDEPAPRPAAAAPAPTPVAPSYQPKRSPSVRELTLDFDALERDAGESSVFRKNSDLPPPPKNLFTREARTAPYRAIDDVPNRVDVAPATRPPSRRPPTVRTPAPAPAAGQPPAARPAPAAASPKSLFTDNLVSDQSLDEVILSYLAEDLDPARRK